jgi:hypothetical protein
MEFNKYFKHSLVLIFVTINLSLMSPVVLAQQNNASKEACKNINVEFDSTQTVKGVGAAQGVEWRDDTIYIYGDGEDNGKIRLFNALNNHIEYTGKQLNLTKNGSDLLSHPTGLTYHNKFGTFIGNTVNQKGTIFKIDWQKFKRDGNLDDAVLHTIMDDAAVNGTRPEFVRISDTWFIATADYGNTNNEIRLYDPQKLSKSTATTDSGVVVSQIPGGPFVQSLHWIDSKELLVLVQNQKAGRHWRLSFVNLSESVKENKLVIVKTIDIDRASELEGFHMIAEEEAIFVTAHQADNVTLGKVRCTEI